MDKGKAIIDWKDGIPAAYEEKPIVRTEIEKFVFWITVGLVAIAVGLWIGYPPVGGNGYTGIRMLRTAITATFEIVGGLSVLWALVKAWNTTKSGKKS